jgi:hypothetical protein
MDASVQQTLESVYRLAGMFEATGLGWALPVDENRDMDSAFAMLDAGFWISWIRTSGHLSLRSNDSETDDTQRNRRAGL